MLRLSPTADRAWQRYADHNGVSVTALIEAVGLQLVDFATVNWPQAIRRAREIDAERARRRRE